MGEWFGEINYSGNDIMGDSSNWQDHQYAKGQLASDGTWYNTNWTNTSKYLRSRDFCWMHNTLASDTDLKIGTYSSDHTGSDPASGQPPC